jgi:hypothetical protein
MTRQAIFAVQSFAQEMRPDTEALEDEWIPFFAQLEQPVRILSLPRRFDLVAPSGASSTTCDHSTHAPPALRHSPRRFASGTLGRARSWRSS